MALLRGNAEGTLDPKWRVTVPTKFRAIFESKGNPVLWKPPGFEQPYLLLSTAEYYEHKYQQGLAEVSGALAEEYVREAVATMDEIELDGACRFVVREIFRPDCSFTQGCKLIFLANMDYMEIWALDVWREREAARRRAHSLMHFAPNQNVPAKPPVPSIAGVPLMPQEEPGNG
jgi:DNA-binding transcriptional regulator/RsmH inhibitor MraZ